MLQAHYSPECTSQSLIFSEIDLGNQWFSAGQLKAKVQSSKELKAFVLGTHLTACGYRGPAGMDRLGARIYDAPKGTEEELAAFQVPGNCRSRNGTLRQRFAGRRAAESARRNPAGRPIPRFSGPGATGRRSCTAAAGCATP